MKRVQRRDFGAIKRAEPTAFGGLRLAAFPTRVGVLTYMNEDGSTRRELRHPEDVFAPESLESLKNVPLTDLHPSGRVDASNFRELTRGHVTEDVRKANDNPGHVAATVIVSDADLIRMIDQGERKELSCGYSADLEETPGEYEGERYDARQRRIIYNHVAVGPSGWGRAGPSASLRLDGLAGDVKEKTAMNTKKKDLSAKEKSMAPTGASEEEPLGGPSDLGEEEAPADLEEIDLKSLDESQRAEAEELLAKKKKLAGEKVLAQLRDAVRREEEEIAKLSKSDEEEDDEEGEESMSGGKKDSFWARAAAEGRGAADFRMRVAGRSDGSSREERIDYASSHERMLARLHNLNRPIERRDGEPAASDVISYENSVERARQRLSR